MHTVLNLCFAKSLRQKIWWKKNIAAHEFSDKILFTPSIRYSSSSGFQRPAWRNHCSQGIDSIASHADVLKGLSRVPAPVHEPLRTSAQEANRTSRLFHTSCFKPCPSYENSHFVNYAKGKTFVVKMSFICMRINNCLIHQQSCTQPRFETETNLNHQLSMPPTEELGTVSTCRERQQLSGRCIFQQKSIISSSNRRTKNPKKTC